MAANAAGVADQLQTNYASDLRHILKVVFDCSTSRLDEPDESSTNHAASSSGLAAEEWEEPGDLDNSPVGDDSSNRSGWEVPNSSSTEPASLSSRAARSQGDPTQPSANQTGWWPWEGMYLLL